MNAVLETWKKQGYVPPAEKPFWECYTVQAPVESVKEAIKGEKRVYLTLINTPDEVVIAGEPQHCLSVIQKLECQFFPLKLNLAIHCEPTYAEYDALMELYHLPVAKRPDFKFYSTSCYQSVPFSSKAIAHSIARAFCDPVDFPRLIQRVHDDGARIFIEVGARHTCSEWIDQILGDQAHISVPLDVKGTRDHVALFRTLAKLVSHQVPVDLSRLFMVS